MTMHYEDLPDLHPPGYAAGLKPERQKLAQVAAILHGGGYLVREPSGVWHEMKSMKAAVLSLGQNYEGKRTPFSITGDDITKFMQNDLPVVRGSMIVPCSQAPAVRFEDSVYVNSWVDRIMKPDYRAANDLVLREPLTLFFRMGREALCGRTKPLTDLHDILAAAMSDDPEELEWRTLMSWLAAPLQQVGRNLQTNVWLLGDKGGMGKGLLSMAILPKIYGDEYCAILSAEEIEHGGWNDMLHNKLFVTVDELDNIGKRKHDWNGYIKKHSTAPTISIRKRNNHSFKVLNFANWMFSSNDEQPACLDAHDRRNILIATSDNDEKKQLSKQLWDWMQTYPDQVNRLCGAIVHFLHHHEVDHKLIDFAPPTLLKAEVQEATSKDIEGLYWLENDDDYPRDQWISAQDLSPYYVRFTHRREAPHPRAMGSMLTKLARKKFIEIDKPSKTHAALYRISSEKFARFIDVVRKKRAAEAQEQAQAAAGGSDTALVLALVPPPKR